MGSIDRRIGIIFLAFLALLGTAVARATYLGAVRAGSLQRAAETQQVTTVTLPAERGTITDRNGNELAISEAADDVAADPYLIKDPLAVAKALSPLLGKPALTLLALLSKPRTGFVYLAHQVPASRANAVLKLKLGGKPIDGMTLIPQVARIYPRSWAASQVIGDIDWGVQGPHGISGIEYRYNSVLSGRSGVRKIVNDAIGQPISVDNIKPTKPGKTIKLTLDAPLQDEVEQVLAGVGAQYSPRGATAIIMNPNTGAILALANWPRINANDPNGAPTYATQNRAVSFNYEPGSTFKAFTVAAAMQDGLVNPSTPFDVPPVLQVADRQIHDAEPHGFESLSVSSILKVSSNIGADLIGMKLGASRFNYWVHRFGFGSPSGVDLPGEDGGIILPLSRYSGSTMGNLPFGQGESVTPIQIATAYSAIANGGILRPPHIVGAIGGKATKLPSGHRVISAGTAAELRNMLIGVYGEGGTASGAGIPGYEMAGKTGTASIAINGHYSSTEYIASFVGMVPANHPQLLGLVVVDRPQGAIYGGSVAAPAFQKIVGWAVPYLGIAPK